MPSYGVKKARHRIEFKEFDGSDNWCDILAGRSSGAATRVQFAGVKIVGLSPSGEPQFAVRENPLMDMRAALFEESILEWTLKADEADSAPMSLTRDTFLEVLDGAVGDWLDAQITTYYQNRKLSEADTKNSSGQSIPQHEDKNSMTPLSVSSI